jgi:hypothetical protein
MTRSMRFIAMLRRSLQRVSQLGTQRFIAQSSHSGQLDTQTQRSPAWLHPPSALQR